MSTRFLPSWTRSKIGFFDFVGSESAKLGLILNAIDMRSGGILLLGKKGTGKSTLLSAFGELLGILGLNFAWLPLNVTEDSLLGSLDLEETVKKGKRIYQKGILSRINGGFLFVEDINLFPPYVLSLITETQSRGELIVEREGIEVREPCNFVICATMNPEEGEISPHIMDRFGMCAFLDGAKDKDRRKEILRTNLLDFHKKEDLFHLVKKINLSKDLLRNIKTLGDTVSYIADLVLSHNVEGHRADLFLLYAALAYAAYFGESELMPHHVDAVSELVLNHRSKKREDLRDEKPQTTQTHELQNERKKDRNSKGSEGTHPSGMEAQIRNGSSDKEEVFPVGERFAVRKFALRKDRIVRKAKGRRTDTRCYDKGGRYVKSSMQKKGEIAIDATIRAAAPFQKLRGRRDLLIIKEEDLRYKEKERKMRHFVIFLVDGSGSMGVERRMVVAKGAIFSLLADCYQKREKVSMIVFRNDKAEIVLPPTSSYEFAKKRLEQIPTGGKTPLSAGLTETVKLIKTSEYKEPEARFLVFILTDGKANVPLGNKPVVEELRDICLYMRYLPRTDYIVIDTEKRGSLLKFELAQKIAEWLGAKYYMLEEIRVQSILSSMHVGIRF
ncbi:MAG: VWA domain-containing protein [Deltaproteobacteria bacterium]|nr:VWA domain-containing protein [Deltaproteobacteria bacterium]